MADPTPALEPAVSPDLQTYRPLSTLALLAFIVAALYTGFVVLFSTVALMTGTPLLLGIWTLFLPAIGLILAVLARSRIRRAEGALGGLALTNWAWWLSLLVGLVYGAFYLGTCIAVWLQAEEFTRAWFEKIRNGDVREAFYFTQEPTLRKFDRPNDPDYMFNRYILLHIGAGRKGPLANFEDHELVRVLRQWGHNENTKIESLGIKDWGYEKGNYRVKETFRFTTEEGRLDVVLTVQKVENKELEGPQWQVFWDTVHFEHQQPSPLGYTIMQAREGAKQFASDWLHKVRLGDVEGAYLDTLPIGERLATPPLVRSRAAAGAVAAGMLGATAGSAPVVVSLSPLGNPGLTYYLYQPGFNAYRAGSLMRSDGFEAPRKVKTEIINDITQNFSRPNLLTMNLNPEGQGQPLALEPERRQLRILQPADIMVVSPAGGGAPPKFVCDGGLLLESDRADLESKNDRGEVVPKTKFLWRVAAIQLLRGGAPAAPQGRGPAGASRVRTGK
jgi:hypothetical protein